MILRPMIPTIVMIIICIILFLLILKVSKGLHLVVRTLMLVLLFIINLRIMLPNGEIEYQTNNIDMAFIIDNTVSMKAEDYNGNNTRMSGVIKDIQYIIRKIPGAHYAVISYEGRNDNILLPYTSDINAIMSVINTLRPPYEGIAEGGNPYNFRDSLATLLKASNKKDDRVRVVFVFTDGEPQQNIEQQDIKPLAEYIDGGAVLGYGTKKGGKMKNKFQSATSEEYLKDKDNYSKDAISKLNEPNLKAIASDLDIDYVHMTKSSDIDKVLANVNKIKGTGEVETELSYKDIYYYFSFIFIILLLVELFLDRRNAI